MPKVTTQLNIPDANKPIKKHKKSRIKGIERRNHILASTRVLLKTDPIETITLADIAKASDVPVSSLYHFYSNVTEVFEGLVETFWQEFFAFNLDELKTIQFQSWQALFDFSIDKSVEFYQSHYEYQQLILSGKAPAKIKLLDRKSDDEAAQLILSLYQSYFDFPHLPNLSKIMFHAMEIVDLFFSLSVQQNKQITNDMIIEAKLASKSYLRCYLPEVLPSKH